MLEWTADGESSSIPDAVDSYLIEGGKIVAQTIHDTVTSTELSASDLGDRSD